MMTEEERQRLFSEMLRKQQDEVATLSQSSMTPEELAAAMQQSGYDPAGKEAMLASMLRGGQDAMFSEMPQGRMMGNVYAAPNWAESLNGAASKLVGGYQMGQARKEQTAIDEKRALSKTAAAKLAAETARKEQLAAAEKGLTGMVTADQKAAMDERRLQQTADIAAASRAAADSRLTRTLTAQEQRAAAAQAAQLALEQARQANKPSAGGTSDAPKIDPVSLRRLKHEESVFNRLGDAVLAAKEVQASGGEIGKPFIDYVAEKAESVPGGGETLSNVIMNKGYTPEEMDVRGRIDGAVEQYRRAFTGANLTQIEKMLGKNWDPTANGISTDEKIKRADNLMNVLNTNREVFDLSMLEKPVAESDALTAEEEEIYRKFPHLRPKQ